jgi:hypothetical protein
MSEAIRLIVDGYLTLKDRTALEDLRTHRRKLKKRLESPMGIDVSRSATLFDEELQVIEAALSRL